MKPLPPFFIVGCARSGTTLLRNLLRLHPNLNAPEETFFYRWGEPFATDGYRHVYLNNPTVKHHQNLDGVGSDKAVDLLAQSHSRREFNTKYARAFLRANKKGQRWFDKTPQNVYGILLIRAQFPKSKIVHIYRNPLNVVASLMAGKVMPKQSLVAAVNYWLEAVQIIGIYKKLPKNNLIEISYEKLTSAPVESLQKLLEMLGEDSTVFDFSKLILPDRLKELPEPGDIYVEPEKHKYLEVLSEADVAYVLEYCGDYMKYYGYKDASSENS